MDVSPAAPVGAGIWVKKFFSYNPSPEKVTDNVKKNVCGFQLDYTNYQFQASILHRAFKDSVCGEKIADARENCADLDTYVATSLKDISCNLVEGIAEYFKNNKKSKHAPRVAIYSVTRNRRLILLAAKDEEKEKIERKNYERYTCFQSVCDSGLPYLDNNIPLTIVNDLTYKHDGFDLERIRDAYGSVWRKHCGKIYELLAIFVRKIKLDSVDKCWASVAPKSGNHPDNLYKSRLSPYSAVNSIEVGGHLHSVRFGDNDIKSNWRKCRWPITRLT